MAKWKRQAKAAKRSRKAKRSDDELERDERAERGAPWSDPLRKMDRSLRGGRRA